MQDEVNTKVVAIMIKGGKISAEVLKKALDKFVQEIEKAQKQMQQPKTYRGKQSIKHLMSQNAAISNIEVTDGNIKSFERTASKYGLDFALKKDVSVEPPSYLVFFKGRDVDVMTAAFKEFSAKTVKNKEQQSIKHLMSQNAAISNIEVTDGNIKSFERTASKYGLDFALKKDVSVEPPSYLVFFKGRDVDVMTAAFKEFSAKTVKQKEQPSIRHKLDQEKAQSKAQHKEKVKVKTKDRGVEL